MPFGRNPFAMRFGGGRSVLQQEHEALLDALAPGWDASEDTANYAECYAYALALTMIWRVNGRLRNMLIPSRMLESLPVFEEATRLRPSATDTLQARRAALAAKFRGLAGNTLGDIYDVCAVNAGVNFVGIGLVDPPTIYWPGINPGPPGFEWTSNRARIGIKLSRDGMDDRDFSDLTERLGTQLRGLLPAWMDFVLGIDSPDGFICDVGIVDSTIVGA